MMRRSYSYYYCAFKRRVFWSPKLSKKKKMKTLNIHRKKEKIQTSFERDERDKTLTCDGFRRVEEEEEEDESSPSFFFLLRGGPSKRPCRARRKRRQNREEEEECIVVVVFESRRGRGEGIDFFELSKVL